MSATYFVRIGALSEVHSARGRTGLSRGDRVIIRTSIGVQLGEIVADSRLNAREFEILRVSTREDELLIQRLEERKREAIEACRGVLRASGSKSTLLDVDQLFDGGSLVLHFLGEVDDVAESLRKEMADRYESVAGTRELARLIQDGCGPGCGTGEGSGCGSGSCAGCSIADACR